jgi:hypothetical protein
MAIVIRPADLEADRGTLIEGLRQHLNPKTDDRRFAWLYAGNPHGPARVWMAVDEAQDILVGSTGLLPRLFYANGQRRLGCVFIDSWTRPDYRFLGPAVRLQRACVEAVRSGELPVGYDYPRQSMMAVYQRLKLAAADELVTRSKLLRADRFIGNRVRSRFAARTLSALVNPLLRLADWGGGTPTGLTIDLAAGRCGGEFDELAARTSADVGLQVARSSEYLNWRFVDHFHLRHEFLVARVDGCHAGFLVLVDDPDADQINVVDVLTEPKPGVLDGLIEHAILLARQRRRSVISMSLLSQDPRGKILAERRFVAERRVPFVVVRADANDERTTGGDRPGFGFTSGDESD